jgi:nitronate monooxygenase
MADLAPSGKLRITVTLAMPLTRGQRPENVDFFALFELSERPSLPIPSQFQGRLSIPAIAAPMFLVSNPDLVVESCRAGFVGTFPALNQRTSEGYEAWLIEIRERLDKIEQKTGKKCAPYGVNLIVHKSNPRVQADLELSIKHKVPLIITSLGAVKELVGAVQEYGGLVFHDVINIRHARKAAEAGVDGLIAVCAGAGGHAGLLSPFALVPEIRKFFDKTIILSGVLSTGQHIAAARLLGADLAYLGTRFIATRESMAPQAFKDMIVSTHAEDIVYTAAISGVHGNFLRPSIEASGAEIDLSASTKQLSVGQHEKRAWKNVWSAGQGVGSIDDIPTTAELCARLVEEYRGALQAAAADIK